MSNKYLGTIASSGSSTNEATTAVPFALPKAGRISVQPTADGYVMTAASGATAASTNSIKVAADQLFDIDLGASEASLAYVPVSGTGNLLVFARTKKVG